MFRLGAHVSIAGGVSKAPKREADLGGNCGQIFVGSPRGWKVGEVDKDEAEKFNDSSRKKGIEPWVVHSTYLINLATPKDGLARKSLRAMQKEIDAAAKLGIPYYVFHPGAHTGVGVETGIDSISNRLSKLEIPDDVRVLLENTAGKGTTLGKKFAQLGKMIKKSDYGYDRLGVCLDTCHMYAGGYDFTSESKLERLLEELDSTIGIENLHYLHLNDSKHPCGSEKDEHAHIGEGEIGEKGFRLFINHEKLRDKPMVLETPVDEKGFEWNIKKLRELRD
ncbi:MAG: deoxyribonuclease IV [Candidatus Aenigmatarchaeota archaeon]